MSEVALTCNVRNVVALVGIGGEHLVQQAHATGQAPGAFGDVPISGVAGVVKRLFADTQPPAGRWRSACARSAAIASSPDMNLTQPASIWAIRRSISACHSGCKSGAGSDAGCTLSQSNSDRSARSVDRFRLKAS